MAVFFAHSAMLADGWAEDVRLTVDDAGMITALKANGDAEGATRLAGPVIPGLVNCHSHAFQRAMAGLAERRGAGPDSFWTWRRTMYRLANRLSPDQIEAIAAQAFVEMLKAGFTTVAEFHYLHNDKSGAAYADPAELSGRIIGAARRTGIAITLLPTLYRHGGFGGAPPQDRQRRFVKSTEQLLDIIAGLTGTHGGNHLVRIGLALHSLRAVGKADLAAAVTAVDPSAPIHIHIAEQRREVDDCLAWSGKRPVEWLFENAPIDDRWCLVHATHMDDAETRALAASGAVAGLCPITEANLGDGLFPLAPYLTAGGRLAIGSDSNVAISPLEELRWLEYGQRLVSERRLIAADDQNPSVGDSLFRRALKGGARAAGQPVGGLAVGSRADFLVLDPAHPMLAGQTREHLLDCLLFAATGNPVRDIFVAGKQVIFEGRHRREREILETFAATLQEIGAD